MGSVVTREGCSSFFITRLSFWHIVTTQRMLISHNRIELNSGLNFDLKNYSWVIVEYTYWFALRVNEHGGTSIHRFSLLTFGSISLANVDDIAKQALHSLKRRPRWHSVSEVEGGRKVIAPERNSRLKGDNLGYAWCVSCQHQQLLTYCTFTFVLLCIWLWATRYSSFLNQFRIIH